MLTSVLATAAATAAIAHVLSVVGLAGPGRAARSPFARAAWAVLLMGAAGLACLVTPHVSVVTAGVTGAVLSLAVAYLARSSGVLHPAGAALWVSWLVVTGAASAFAVDYLVGQHLSSVTVLLLALGAGLAGVTIPSAVIQTREGWDPLLRVRWPRREATPPAVPRPGPQPMVSIHVPVHAEPPEVVVGTLDRLAALRWARYEVLVIDNNTDDPALWKPVERRCAELGSRFRFVHVEGLDGAKAGALNLALELTDPQAELIGLVDADYHAEPDWLADLVPAFAEPHLGFVQCPHAYRDVTGAFQRWADAEYRVFFETGMVSLDEHAAGLTVGTMSLIRRTALAAAGGWATWCLTEDSELAIRIHAAGYSSRYTTTPYGRGLIPETFDGYRKQRKRWTFGPVQEFRRHHRLFFGRRAGMRGLSAGQRLHHANHGLDVACIGLRTLSIVPLAAAAISMLVHDEHIAFPFALFMASTAVLLSNAVMRVLIFRRVLGTGLRRMLGATVAFAALHHAIVSASLAATLARPATWVRTNKFPSVAGPLTALRSTITESVLGVLSVAGGIGLAIVAGGGLPGALAIGLVLAGLPYLCGPGVALVAVSSGRLRQRRRSTERAPRLRRPALWSPSD